MMPGVPPGGPDPRTYLDIRNTLLGRVPALLETGSVTAPQGTLGIVTIRTASTTMTVLVTRDELADWIRVLQDQLGKLSSTRLVTGITLE